jgi:biopolymer transport protein TolQ
LITLLPISLLLLQNNILELVLNSGPVSQMVMALLLGASVVSWAIVYSKWTTFRKARSANAHFLRAFRKASGLEAVAVASEQFRMSPLVAVFDFGYEEVERQAKMHGTITNKLALERSLQLGISEEMAKLERNLNWLATVATVSPFVGLFGTVFGIIGAFNALSTASAASLRAVAPGIADALVATAAGLFAAIPAAVFYNHYGHVVKELYARMEDFGMEFLNLTERMVEEHEMSLRNAPAATRYGVKDR